MEFKGNSLHLTLKRMPDLITIEHHSTKKGHFFTARNNSLLSHERNSHT